MKSKTSYIIGTTIAIATLAVLPAFAATSTSTAAARQQQKQQNTAAKTAAVQSRDDKMIDQRISDLNQLINKVQEMKNITDAQKNTISTTIQSLSSGLTVLKGRIDSSTSSTSLKADTQAITQAYRVYALFMPQIRIIAAADRVESVLSMTGVIASKVQLRLNQASSTSPEVTSAMADITAKLNDANTQAHNAANTVLPLLPDGGDKTKMAANNAALKQGREAIRTAQADIAAARKDLSTILKAFSKLPKKGGASNTASSTASH